MNRGCAPFLLGIISYVEHIHTQTTSREAPRRCIPPPLFRSLMSTFYVGRSPGSRGIKWRCPILPRNLRVPFHRPAYVGCYQHRSVPPHWTEPYGNRNRQIYKQSPLLPDWSTDVTAVQPARHPPGIHSLVLARHGADTHTHKSGRRIQQHTWVPNRSRRLTHPPPAAEPAAAVSTTTATLEATTGNGAYGRRLHSTSPSVITHELVRHHSQPSRCRMDTHATP